ncbi:Protein FAM35A [Channa argus]|uniref:Protein FAM35A n=1 Tax=Channa argus TaxID=215402 RepID=A0A6G1R065_CHAAH|nr:Protein FAM35A [Channa argus]
MCDRSKIHVFLGPPPPSFVSASVPDSGDCPPAGWRHLEFYWTRGHLRPTRGGAGTEEDRTTEAERLSLSDQRDETNTDLSGLCCELDRTGDESRGQEERAGSGCTINTKQDNLHSDHHTAAGSYVSRDNEPGPENEDRCSASVGEYLDSCFPTDQPEPDPEHQPAAAVPPPSAHTQYLSAWTLSQALVLRGRRGLESAASPEKTPPCMSSSTPELFSSATSSPRASIELFSQPSPTPRAEEGGVFLEATTEGVLCSQESTTTSGSPLRSPSVKKARLSEDCRTEVRQAGSNSSNTVLQGVITVTLVNVVEMKVVLWRRAAFWDCRLMKTVIQAVWDFRVLLVREGLTSNLLELHSTPWSSIQPLDPTDRRVLDLYPPRPIGTGNSSSLELDLDTLLSQKYSGNIELRVHIIAFHFQDSPPSQNAPQPVLVSSTPLADILEALSRDITYIGCSRCCTELDTDTNGIYDPCYPCLPHTAVCHYFRPSVLTVSGRGSSQVCVQVPPVPLQRILNAPPDKLHRSSAPGSEVKHIQVAAERIQTLLSLPRKTFIITVRSHFLFDENSVPINQDLTLLDLQFPT